jgi:hypothetical protein
MSGSSQRASAATSWRGRTPMRVGSPRQTALFSTEISAMAKGRSARGGSASTGAEGRIGAAACGRCATAGVPSSRASGARGRTHQSTSSKKGMAAAAARRRLILKE